MNIYYEFLEIHLRKNTFKIGHFSQAIRFVSQFIVLSFFVRACCELLLTLLVLCIGYKIKTFIDFNYLDRHYHRYSGVY